MIRKEIIASRPDVNHGDLVKSAELGHDLVSILVFSDSDNVLLNLPWQRKFGTDFALLKQGNVNSLISVRSSIRKALKKLAKRCAAMAVFIERNSEEALWSRISNSSYFVNQLPTIGALLAARKGKIILELEIPTLYHLKGFRMNSRYCLYPNKSGVKLRDAEKTEVEEEEEESPAEDIIGHDSSSFSHNPKAILLNSISIIRRELPEPSLGWPLLRRKKSSPNQIEIIKPEARDKSVVEWVMNLPNRVITVVNQSSLDSTIKDCEAEEAIQKSEEDSQSDMIQNPNEENSELEYDAEVSVSLKTNVMDTNSKPGWPLLRITPSTTSDSFSTESENPVETEIFLPALRKMPKDLELRCKQFSLRELKQATSEFSAENLIGEGGCSKVYKGCLPDGKPVAVKILKSYKEAWSDFCLEVDIVSSLEHKHITPLVGVCVEDDHIISVYDFFPNGSLEEVLHGQSQKSVLPWRVRFKVATAIAKALSYLHNECSPPVIHRDVKSSNILLSDDFQPQLSDFGLAIWGPTDSTYMIDSNVVGTFGYIAPEYFMQGRVSEKIDVYSFGVVLLELLSGRKPINSKAPEGQQSLIQWAKTLLEKKNLQELLDPALDGDFDIAQMQRMVLAAFLCLNELDVTRPKISQILELLQGEKEPTEWYDFHATELKVSMNQENDVVSPQSFPKLYTYLSVPFTYEDLTLECGDYTKSKFRAGKKRRLTLKDYLKKAQEQPYDQIGSPRILCRLLIH